MDARVAAPLAPLSPAAHVRPSVAAPKRPSAPADLEPPLAAGARAALFFQSGEHEQTFDIALDEALLGNVRCRISLGPDGVDATFVVDDVNQRRLLDGESARLRQSLTDKGLKVRQVRVVQIGDPSAPDLLT